MQLKEAKAECKITKPLYYQRSWIALILISLKAEHYVAILLLPAISLSGRIWPLAFNPTFNHAFGNVGGARSGAHGGTGCSLSSKRAWQALMGACTSWVGGRHSPCYLSAVGTDDQAVGLRARSCLKITWPFCLGCAGHHITGLVRSTAAGREDRECAGFIYRLPKCRPWGCVLM